MHPAIVNCSVHLYFSLHYDGILDNSDSWSSWIVSCSDTGSASSALQGIGSVMENVVVFMVGPLQS